MMKVRECSTCVDHLTNTEHLLDAFIFVSDKNGKEMKQVALEYISFFHANDHDLEAFDGDDD